MCNSCAMMLELWELFWRIAIYRKSAFVNDQYIACNFKNDRPRLFRVVVSSPYESEGRDSSPSCVLLCFLGNVCVGYNTSRACPRLPIGQCDNGEREVVATWAAIRAKSLISSVVGDIYNFITSMKIHWPTIVFHGQLFVPRNTRRRIGFSISKSLVLISLRTYREE